MKAGFLQIVKQLRDKYMESIKVCGIAGILIQCERNYWNRQNGTEKEEI